MELINDLIMQTVASPWVFLILFAVTVVDGFFPPVPSETVLVAAAAVAASSGGVNVPLLCVCGALGAMVGDNIAYALGRAVGTERFGWMRRARVASAFDATRRALRRGGSGLILGARYIPVGRVAVNMIAGAVRFGWRRFLPLSALGGVLWAAYSVGIGMLAGQWLAGQPLMSAGIGVVVALAIGIVVDRLSARRRRDVAAGPAAAEGSEAAAATRMPVMG